MSNRSESLRAPNWTGARARGAAWVVSSLVGSNCEVYFWQVNIIVQAASCPDLMTPALGGPF